MQPKPRQPGERFATLLTLVVLLPAVDYHVVLQLEVANEGPAIRSVVVLKRCPKKERILFCLFMTMTLGHN